MAQGEPIRHRILANVQVVGPNEWTREVTINDGEDEFDEDYDADTDTYGVTYEYFPGAGGSIMAGLQQREYQIDLPNADGGDSLEFLVGGRAYFIREGVLRPFAGGNARVGQGISFDGGEDSDFLFGFDAAGGVGLFLPSGFTADLRIAYEFTWNRADVAIGPVDVEVDDLIHGFSVQLGVGWAF